MGLCCISQLIEYFAKTSTTDSIEIRMHKSKPYVVRSEKQLATLASAMRQEIVDVLAEMGVVSVAELAAILGRPADTLYFHLRQLTQAGLVRREGYRSKGSRQEALYRTPARALMLEYKPEKGSNREAVSAIVGSMLRLGIRDFGRAFRAGDVIVSGSHRELWALRKTSRLSPAQIAGVNRSIHRLLKISKTNPTGRGRLYAVTVLLTPLDRRRKSDRAGGADKAAKKRGKAKK